MRKKIFFLLLLPMIYAYTIADKKESFQQSNHELDQETEAQLKSVNLMLAEKRHSLKTLYEKASELYASKCDEASFFELLKEINSLKAEIAEIEETWRDETSTLIQNDSYALWHQPDTTLLQLVMDYGTQDCIYLVPPEVGGIHLSLNSNLPIPRESWNECLDLILSGHGVGVRQLNPYLRELFFLRTQPSAGLKHITSNPHDLDILPNLARVCFVLSPDTPDPRGVLQFLQKFSNPMTTTLHVIGGDIFIVSSTELIKELLKLYDFVKTGNHHQDYRLVTSSKINAQQMETILNSAFLNVKTGEEMLSLKIVPLQTLSHALFLFGTKDEVNKAVKLIRDVEAQIENPQEKTIFWYTAKHSDAEDLANTLAKVYDQLVGGASFTGVGERASEKKAEITKKELLVVQPAVAEPGKQRISHKTSDGQNNFIVDAKTGSIIMVVEQNALPRIKELLKKLDVPKKMVQLEVLLFEKKISNKNKFGLNLLRLGSSASHENSAGLSWSKVGSGILEFLISHNKGSVIPAYDLAYNFLLGQEDVQINASPSVTTINQTPAKIAIVDEISIYNGADKDKNTSYSRSQYGITIEITPTINVADEDEESEGFVTLDTDITFDTTKNNKENRPDVTRRHINNHVRIADGQTVILGGLRRKSTEDNKESIPFLGEIPGLGKLFSTTDLTDNSTEMFVFITPKIISDPIEDAERIRREELKKRPGDLPEFMHELMEARARERCKRFQGGLTALFGQNGTFAAKARESQGEYDGR